MTVERENARAEYERGWREGAEAMREEFQNRIYQIVEDVKEAVTYVSLAPLPEPPKEGE